MKIMIHATRSCLDMVAKKNGEMFVEATKRLLGLLVLSEKSKSDMVEDCTSISSL